MKEQKQFQPYIPAEKVTPEITVTSIIMGMFLAVIFGIDFLCKELEGFKYPIDYVQHRWECYFLSFSL